MLALHRLAQCPREQHSQLRVSAPFTQLLGLLEKQAFTLGPKVSPFSSATVDSAVGGVAEAAVQQYACVHRASALSRNCMSL